MLFEKDPKGGGLMRTNIPSFRLPASVLDEEVDRIVDMGVEARFGAEIKSLKGLLAEGFDAVFVGTGAPRGKDLNIPGRKEADKNIHIGIDWLTSIAFGHVDKVGKRVVVIGGGNTAMDCCRTALRLGAEKVTVTVRSPAQGDEGVGLGAQGRAARGHPDPRQPQPQVVRHQGRQARRRRVREDGREGRRREGPAEARGHPARPSPSTATTC